LPAHYVVDQVFPDASLDEMLKKFKTGKGHLAVVHDVFEPDEVNHICPCFDAPTHV
jgi:hypothetical protein